MADKAHFDLIAAIENWRRRISVEADFTAEARRELDAHLLDSITGFRQRGLNDEECFLLACHRVGKFQQLDKEFINVDSDMHSKVLGNWAGILSLLWMIGGCAFIFYSLRTNSLQFRPFWLYLLAVFYGWLGVAFLLGVAGVRRARITGRIFAFGGIGLFTLVVAYILFAVVAIMHEQTIQHAATIRQRSSESYNTTQAESSVETNSVIGLWRCVKVDGNGLSKFLTNRNDTTYISFDTDGVATFSFRSTPNSTKTVKAKFAIFGSNRLAFRFDEPPLTYVDYRATQYKYRFIDNKLRMDRPALGLTNTYERAREVPF